MKVARPWIVQGGVAGRQHLSDAIIALVHLRRPNIKATGVGKYIYDGWPAGTMIVNKQTSLKEKALHNHYIFHVQISARECEAEYMEEFDEPAEKEFNNEDMLDNLYDNFKTWFDVVWPEKKPSLWSRIKRFFRSE